MITSEADVALQRAILDAFAADPQVEPNEVGVEVDNSTVTLTGYVSSWTKKLAAEDAAHRVRGVLDVANDLVIRVPTSDRRTDTEIANAIRQHLLWDAFVPEQQVHTTVRDGIVTLHGIVRSKLERDEAARALRNVPGICAIENQIAVKKH
jgi:osmotically-inducible protein OsmY